MRSVIYLDTTTSKKPFIYLFICALKLQIECLQILKKCRFVNILDEGVWRGVEDCHSKGREIKSRSFLFLLSVEALSQEET